MNRRCHYHEVRNPFVRQGATLVSLLYRLPVRACVNPAQHQKLLSYAALMRLVLAERLVLACELLRDGKTTNKEVCVLRGLGIGAKRKIVSKHCFFLGQTTAC